MTARPLLWVGPHIGAASTQKGASVARITMEDIAKRVGVSRALVSLAYRNLPGVSEETRAKILGVGAELGYTPNQVAARLASRGGDTIGVFLQDLHNDLFADFYDGVREAAHAAGKQLVLAVGAIDGGYDAHALEALRSSRVDVIIAGGLQLPDDAVRAAASTVPLVCAFRSVDGVDSVTSDDLQGSLAATQHLISLGHRDIAFFANPPSDGYRERRRGYREAMEHAGLDPIIVETSYDRATVANDAGRVFDSGQKITAVFAHNDQAALGVLDAMVVRGLRPSIDVSVVGYDNSSVGRFPGTALTTVDVDGRLIGKIAAETALARLDDSGAEMQHRVSQPMLVSRATTGPAPASPVPSS